MPSSIVTIAAELTSITAEVIVVALTWRKTFEMHKQWKEFERRRRVSKVLLVDGTVLVFSNGARALMFRTCLGTVYFVYGHALLTLVTSPTLTCPSQRHHVSSSSHYGF